MLKTTKISIIIILFISLFFKKFYSQDPVFSQINTSMHFINPAMSGISNNYSFNKKLDNVGLFDYLIQKKLSEPLSKSYHKCLNSIAIKLIFSN